MEDDPIRELVSTDPARSRAVMEGLLSAARAVGDAEGEAVLLQRIGQLEFRCGRIQAADELFRQAGEAAEAAGDAVGVARSLQARADVADARGRPDEALIAYERAGALLLAAGETLGWWTCRLGLGRALTALGRLDEAEAHLRGIAESEETAGLVALRCDSVSALGELAEERDGASAACALFARALDLARETGDDLRVANRYGRLAGALVALGERRQAEAAAMAARALHAEVGARDLVALDCWSLAEALEGQGRLEEALETLLEARDIYGDCGMAAQARAVGEQAAALESRGREGNPSER